MKENILISHCLLGTPCRYDGKSKPVDEIEKLETKYFLIPVCPEVEGGLSTPRLPCEICDGKVIRSDGKDLTAFYQEGAEVALGFAKKYHCKKAILKEKSPSCGKCFIYDGSFSGKLKEGQGITAKLLAENKITLYNEVDFVSLLKK